MRVIDGDNIMDETPIHPESYDIASKLLNDIGFDICDVGSDKLSKKLDDIMEVSREELTKDEDVIGKSVLIVDDNKLNIKVAKQQAEQIVSEAQKEAENIIRNSKDSAAKALDEIEQQTRIKEQQFSDVKKQFDIYKAKMESLLISQSELIKEINKDED